MLLVRNNFIFLPDRTIAFWYVLYVPKGDMDNRQRYDRRYAWYDQAYFCLIVPSPFGTYLFFAIVSYRLIIAVYLWILHIGFLNYCFMSFLEREHSTAKITSIDCGWYGMTAATSGLHIDIGVRFRRPRRWLTQRGRHRR